jgi:hypothetical protein
LLVFEYGFNFFGVFIEGTISVLLGVLLFSVFSISYVYMAVNTMKSLRVKFYNIIVYTYIFIVAVFLINWMLSYRAVFFIVAAFYGWVNFNFHVFTTLFCFLIEIFIIVYSIKNKLLSIPKLYKQID